MRRVNLLILLWLLSNLSPWDKTTRKLWDSIDIIIGTPKYMKISRGLMSGRFWSTTFPNITCIDHWTYMISLYQNTTFSMPLRKDSITAHDLTGNLGVSFALIGCHGRMRHFYVQPRQNNISCSIQSTSTIESKPPATGARARGRGGGVVVVVVGVGTTIGKQQSNGLVYGEVILLNGRVEKVQCSTDSVCWFLWL